MAEVSSKTAYTQITQLLKIGLLELKDGKSNKFRLKKDDKRALSLVLIDSEEYSRKLNEIHDEEDISYFDSVKFEILPEIENQELYQYNLANLPK
ncbi:MAG: hypothetical protein LBM96_06755 [Methanobrevibacter sp.]|jgi:hypothetical protein|nr:hypothetical protein [Candidatus Methanoflexus mossambicus]